MKIFFLLMLAPRGGYIIGEVASRGHNDYSGSKTKLVRGQYNYFARGLKGVKDA